MANIQKNQLEIIDNDKRLMTNDKWLKAKG